MIPEGPSHPHTVAPHLRFSCPWSKGGSPGLQGWRHRLWAGAKLKFLLCGWGLGQYSLDFIHLGVFLSLLPGPLTLIFTLSLMSGPFTYSDPAAGDVESEDLAQASSVVVIRAC